MANQLNKHSVDFRNKRALSICKKAVDELKLDLSGQTVLTEIGSNFYLYLPVIALLANAKKVIAWCKDSSYGSASDIISDFKALDLSAKQMNAIVFRANECSHLDIEESTIITNSEALRPLNENFLSKIKNDQTVISLMYEAWEIRREDIDIEYCKQKDLRVAGTNENHPLLRVFEYGGPLACKMSFEAGYEVFRNNIMVWSDDEFGQVATKAFKAMGASSVVSTTNVDAFYEALPALDFIYLCNYHEKRDYISNKTGSVFNLTQILDKNPNLGIVHLYGTLNSENLLAAGLNVHPAKNGRAMFMTNTLGYAGLNPIIYLQAAGLKVAEEMIAGKFSTISQPISGYSKN